jgi:hypothetical protein
MPRRVYLRWADRAVFTWLSRRYPRMLDALTIVRPDTVVRWHRMGVSAHWRWRSRSLGGRPRIGKGVRDLIRRMSLENPLWHSILGRVPATEYRCDRLPDHAVSGTAPANRGRCPDSYLRSRRPAISRHGDPTELLESECGGPAVVPNDNAGRSAPNFR